MRQLTEPYDLKAWRRRMGWRQRDAAQALGLSIDGYRRAEYRCEDRAGAPVARTLAILARMLERERAQGPLVYGLPPTEPAAAPRKRGAPVNVKL